MPPEHNGWNEWSRHVLAELERLNDCYEKLDTKLTDIRSDVIILKTKAGLFGAGAGLLAGLAVKLLVP